MLEFWQKISKSGDGESVQNETSLVSLRYRFAGGNKNITKKKGERIITL